MVTTRREKIAILLVVVVAASGVAGAMGAQATADESAVATAAQGGATAHDAGGATAQGGEQAAESACAAEPPSDGSDPDEDAIGWEDGYWYDESLDVNESGGLSDDELEAVVARTTARVEAVRCIEFEGSVPVSVISRDELRERQFFGEVTPELRTFDNAKFEAMFLVGEGTDAIEVQNQNAGGSVLGFYSPEADEIVVVAESADDLRIGELTLAHELVHAWQDRTHNLSGDHLSPRLRDDANARNGLVEGDASYTESLYEQRCSEEWECLDAPAGPSGDLANMGVYFLNFQPYSDGPRFVQFVRNVGGWDAVDALYEDPPESTEQVIHPEKYGTDSPTNVSLDDAATDEWTRVNPRDRPGYAELGESALMSMFVYPYYDSQGRTEIVPTVDWLNFNETGEVGDFDPLSYQSNYSTGWDGDRLHAYRNDDDELGYVWRLAWDSPQDARQFVEGYRQVLDYWGAEEVGPNTYRVPGGEFADAFHVEVEGTTVTITNAPTVEELSEVRTDVDVSAAEAEPNETAGDDAGTATETATETDDAADSATIEVEANETATNETTASEAVGQELAAS
ncbi:Hvo_1808 family surface protein [Halorussus salilacus]|uniref:Hvo_1808 family surface protein n=1 Tax=Halorussus salilacus TaxID=2953750 RepID=UPI0020A10A5F|nr:Hvo_1808 family surface protein [Halorussus salilacus]USZ67064.1 Hvo_1808 family surface protein [Halorussus salilacus]